MYIYLHLYIYIVHVYNILIHVYNIFKLYIHIMYNA